MRDPENIMTMDHGLHGPYGIRLALALVQRRRRLDELAAAEMNSAAPFRRQEPAPIAALAAPPARTFAPAPRMSKTERKIAAQCGVSEADYIRTKAERANAPRDDRPTMATISAPKPSLLGAAARTLGLPGLTERKEILDHLGRQLTAARGAGNQARAWELVELERTLRAADAKPTPVAAADEHSAAKQLSPIERRMARQLGVSCADIVRHKAELATGES